MLREDGFVLDDGTTARFAEDHYFMTTTTANAVKVMQHLEFCQQVLWPDLDVQMVSVTEQWAQYAVAGPQRARRAGGLARPGHDVSNEAFPYLAMRAGRWCAAACRPALPALVLRRARLRDRRAGALRRRAGPRRSWTPARQYGIVPYGTEALGVMRIEKGHAAGDELNGQTTAARSRLRQDDVEEEGLHRPLHGGAAGADRRRRGRRWSASGRSTPATGFAPARISCRRAPMPSPPRTTRAI